VGVAICMAVGVAVGKLFWSCFFLGQLAAIKNTKHWNTFEAFKLAVKRKYPMPKQFWLFTYKN